VPFGENTRYDLVVDDGLRLGRVQCKSGQLVSGVVRFKTASTYAHHRSATGCVATTRARSNSSACTATRMIACTSSPSLT